MPKIQRLPPSVASLIAAGEVIERPASLLKELLENALDAGARKVDIESRGAGRKSLRVVDDGCGMEPKDVELSLERHATSKLGVIQDLDTLRTFGFRGEALYAACAVAKLSIASCQPGAKTGWRVEAQAGKVLSSGPAPAVPGTAVEAGELFFNTPARLKFLKSDAFEKSKLAGVVEEAALANPETRFVYKSEGRVSLRFDAEPGAEPAARDLARIRAVFGEEAARGLLTVAAERPGFRLRMYLSPLDNLLGTRSFQHFFVNRRPIESRLLQQALYRAYGEHKPRERHPLCVAHIELSPDAFDVNVHPGKREIRFKKDRDLFELIFGLAASALAKSRPAAPISVEARPAAGPAAGADVPAFSIGGAAFFVGDRPVERSSYQTPAPSLALESSPSLSFGAPQGAPAWFTPPYRFLGQIERSWLVFEAAGGLFVLDQHAAAERILFERFLREVGSSEGVRVQRLMLPLPVELPASAVAKVLAQKKRLSKLGFELAPFGKTTLHVLEVPALFEKAADLKELCHRLLDSLADPAASARDVQHDAVATIACKAAVKAHDRLGEKEALALLDQLKDCADGSCCPHGRRAMLALNRDELARRFERPGAVPL